LTGGVDRTVRLWNPLRLDVKSEALSIQVYRDGHIHPVSAIASQDSVLLSASNKTFVVTDMVTAKTMFRVPNGHDGRINAVDIKRDAIYLTASYDGTVKLWDARNTSRQTPIQICSEAKDSVSAVAFDGEHCFYTASIDGQLRHYDARKGSITCCDVGSPIVSMAIADDCLVVSCLDSCMRLLDKPLGELLNTYHGAHTTDQYAVACAITPSCVVTGSEMGARAVLYDLVTSKVVQELEPEASGGMTCAVAAHETCIVTATHGEIPLVWTNDRSQVSRD
jgi:WD40 repeat protein